VAALSSPQPAARIAAANALGISRTQSAVGPLVAALRADPSADVRRAVARALAQIGTAEGAAALTEAARSDPDAEVRAIASAATSAGEPAPPSSTAPAPWSAPSAAQPSAAEPAPTATQPTVVIVQQPQTEPERPARPPRPPRPPGRRYVVSGWATFGALWGLAVVTGTIVSLTGAAIDSEVTMNFGWMVIIPVVGPALAAGMTWNEDSAAVALNMPFWLGSLGQAAGIVLIGVGYGLAARAAREQAADPEAAAPAARRFGLAVVPSAPGGGGPGLTVSGFFL
jgi:hypothetical protein